MEAPVPALDTRPHDVIIDDASRTRMTRFFTQLNAALDAQQTDLDHRQAEIAGWRAVCSDIERMLAGKFGPRPVPVAQTEPDQAPVEDAVAVPASVESATAEEAARAPASSAPIAENDVDPATAEAGKDDGGSVAATDGIPQADRAPDFASVLTEAHEKAAAAPPAGEVAPAPSPAPTLKQLVAPLMREHPDWTARQIADHIGKPKNSVLSTMSVVRREAAQASQEPVEPAPAPRAPAPRERLLGPRYVPPATVPVSKGSAVVTKPPMRPRGARFYLRDDEGRYLHFSCAGMTADKAHAWIGDERQLAGCRKAFKIAVDLREQVVEREPVNA